MMFLAIASAWADAPVLLPDARFALALYCDPTCDDTVLDTLDDGLAGIASVEGFSDFQGTPARIMGQAGTDFGIPDAAYVDAFGDGVDRPERLAVAQEVLVAWFAGPRAEARRTFAVAHAAFARAATQAHGWVEDLDTQSVYGADAWAAKDPAGPVTDWFVIDSAPMDAAQPDGPLRLVTRGLRRYGDAELLVEDVDAVGASDVSYVVNAVAAQIDRAGEAAATLRIASGGVSGTAQLAVVPRREDDPEDPLLRVTFDGEVTVTVDSAAPPPAAPSPPLASTAPVPAAGSAAPRTLAEAGEIVRSQMAGPLKRAVAAGLPSGEVIAVSVPFPTRTGGREYLWAEISAWTGGTITGRLATEPVAVDGLQKGDFVSVREADVFDYVWKHADGSREGNVTRPFVR